MKTCSICAAQQERMYGVVSIHFNDIVKELCTNCMNELKIRMNEREAAESVWRNRQC